MENTTENTRTVQNYRHAAKRSLTTARERLALRNDATQEVYNLLNGQIEAVLAGRPGYSQEEQVERLTEARAKVQTGIDSLPEKVAEAREAVLAQIDGWEQSITEKAAEALTTLDEAIEYAATRDFDAHQRSKGRYGYDSTDEGDDSEEEPEDED